MFNGSTDLLHINHLKLSYNWHLFEFQIVKTEKLWECMYIKILKTVCAREARQNISIFNILCMTYWKLNQMIQYWQYLYNIKLLYDNEYSKIGHSLEIRKWAIAYDL